MSRQSPFTPTQHMVALDAHLDLMERLQRGDKTSEYWGSMLDHQRQDLEDALGGGVGLDPQYRAGEGWEDVPEGAVAAVHESIRLSYSPTYWIASNVVDLIHDNISTLPDEVGVHPFDLVTQHGFAYFEEPAELLDRNHRICSVKAVSWAVVPSQVRTRMADGSIGLAPAMTVTFYSDLRDFGNDALYNEMSDRDRENIIATFGPLQMLAHTIHPWVVDESDRTLLQVEVNDFREGIEKRSYRFGEEIPVHPDLVLMLKNPPHVLEAGGEDSDNFGTWLTSFFLVIGQRLVSRVKPNRNIRRRMERREAPDWGEIRVIDLRRYTDQGVLKERHKDQPEDWWHNWSYRHRVKSHWRRCWVKGPDGEKRLVWRPVKSYIRGPDHLPVIERDDVYRAVR